MDHYNKCANCGSPLEPGDKFCRNCGKPFEEPAPELPSAPIPPVPPIPPSDIAESKYTPWESRSDKGFFRSLWETWRDSVFYPNRFFSQLPFDRGLGNPILFALIFAELGYVINKLWGWLFAGFILSALSQYLEDAEPMFLLSLQGGADLLSFIVWPIVVLVLLFIMSGIYHLVGIIFGWAKRSFEATFRAVAYSAGPLVFAVVPMCGWPIGVIWAMVLTIIGYKHMQQTTTGKASVTVLFPLIFCCCAIAMLSIIFGAAILALIKGATGGYYNWN